MAKQSKQITLTFARFWCIASGTRRTTCVTIRSVVISSLKKSSAAPEAPEVPRGTGGAREALKSDWRSPLLIKRVTEIAVTAQSKMWAHDEKQVGP